MCPVHPGISTLPRKVFSVLFGVVLLGLGSCDERDYPAAQTVFWRLERNGKVSWLFGTIHAPHPRFQPLPPEVERALRSSQQFYSEMELSEAAQLEMFRAMRLPSGESLRTEIGQERFERMLQLAGQLGLPLSGPYLDGQRIWAAALMFSQPRDESGPPLDLLLAQAAQQAGCTTAGLETPAEQAAVFGDLDNELQIALLDDAMTSAAAGYIEHRRLLDTYLAQDLPALIREVSISMDEALPEPMRERLMDALLRRRNHRFLERILPATDDHSCFIAVGAAHLFGPEGMLALFDQAGFEVTPAPFQFGPSEHANAH